MSRKKFVLTNNIWERLEALGAREPWKNVYNLAEQAGSGRSTAQGWKNGTAKPGFDNLIRIYELTGCDPGWLLTGDGEMFRHEKPVEVGEAARIFAELTAKIDQLEFKLRVHEAELAQYREILAGLKPADLDDEARDALQIELSAIKDGLENRRQVGRRRGRPRSKSTS